MNYKSKFSFGEWNIGFIDSSFDLLKAQKLSVSWMKHSYKTCGFADPFLYKVTDTTFEVFAEEINFYRKNACLVSLVVDRQTKVLLERKVILKLDTHLSYPFIIRNSEGIFVVPENVASGKLNVYKYDEQENCLIFQKVLVELPLADATIVGDEECFYLFATKKGYDNSDLYFWSANQIFGEYSPQEGRLIKSDFMGSRMAGNFFKKDGRFFRFAQDCNGGYGRGIVIYRVINLNPISYKEEEIHRIYPTDPFYRDGIHTLNINEEVTVVDGYRLRYNPFVKVIKKLR